MERFINKLRKLRRRGVKITTVESAVAYLEADPWSFGSGYAKAELIRLLTRCDLKEPHANRLRRVAAAAVDKGDRREFRWYCRLARKVDSPRLRAELAGRLEDRDSGVRRRASWMLEWVRKHHH